MPDPINPGDPGFQPPQPPKRINPEDIFDAARFQQQLSESMNKAFKNIDLSQLEKAREIMQSIGKEASKVEISDISKDLIASRESVSEAVKKEKEEEGKWEDQILKRVSTAERYKHQQLIKEKNELIKKVKDLGVVELNNLKGTTKDKEKLKEVEKAFEILQLEKVQEIEKSFSKETKRTNIEALASEGNLGAKAKLLLLRTQDELNQKTDSYTDKLISAAGLWGVLFLILSKAAKQAADMATTGAALKAAGEFKPGVSISGERVMKRAEERFAGVSPSVVSREQQYEFLKTMSKAPRTLKDSSASMKQLLGVFGTEIPEASQIVDLYTRANMSSNASMKDLLKTFAASKKAANVLNVDHRDLINTQLQMREALRGVTTNGEVAIKAMDLLTKPLKAIGASKDEVDRFNVSFARFLGTLTVKKLMGLSAFATGKLPTDKDIELMAKNPLEVVSKAFVKMGKMFPERNKLVALEQFASEMGLETFGVRGIPILRDLIKEMEKGAKLSEKDLKARFKEAGLQDINSIMDDGLKTIAQGKGFVTALEDVIGSWAQDYLMPITNGVNILVRKLTGAPSGPAAEQALMMSQQEGYITSQQARQQRELLRTHPELRDVIKRQYYKVSPDTATVTDAKIKLAESFKGQ